MTLLPLSGSEPIFDSYVWASDKYKNAANCYDYALADCHLRFEKTTPGDNDLKREGHDRELFGPIMQTFCSTKKCAEEREKFNNDYIDRVLGDNKGHIKVIDISVKCEPGWYKVMSFISYGPEQDFHWYRQNQGVRYKILEGDSIQKIAKMFGATEQDVSEALKGARKPLGEFDGVFSDIDYIHTVKNTNEQVPQKYIGEVITIPCNIWSHKQGWGNGPLVTDAKHKIIINPKEAATFYDDLHYKYLCSFAVQSGKVHTGATGDNNTPEAKTQNFAHHLNRRVIPNALNVRKIVPRLQS